jgi:hypothetical protein
MSTCSTGSVVMMNLDRIPAEAGAQARVKIRDDVVRHYAAEGFIIKARLLRKQSGRMAACAKNLQAQGNES